MLEAQEAGIAAVKPGVTLRDVNRACYDVLIEKGLVQRPAHGACHWIGMEVHDPGNYLSLDYDRQVIRYVYLGEALDEDALPPFCTDGQPGCGPFGPRVLVGSDDAPE